MRPNTEAPLTLKPTKPSAFLQAIRNGQLYGFPECCIWEFAKDIINRLQPAMLRGSVFANKKQGIYVPCDECRAKAGLPKVNQFIFTIVSGPDTYFGTLQAHDGRSAKEELQKACEALGIKIDKLCLSGVMSKVFQLEKWLSGGTDCTRITSKAPINITKKE